MRYWQYLAHRVVGMIASLFGLSIIIFVVSRVLPGNPARMALGPMATDQQVHTLTHQMGLDQPLPLQYLHYLTGLLSGDLGMSLTTKNPVAQDLAHYLPATLELVIVSMVLTVVFGVLLGVVAATHKDGSIDNFSRVLAFISVSVPGFFIGIILQLVFGYFLQWLPIVGRIANVYQGTFTHVTGFFLVDTLLAGNLGAFGSVVIHLLLPAVSLSLISMGQVMRITRSSMIDFQNKEFIEAERGFGLPNWLVTYKYTLKNAFTPTLTILGLLAASLLGNAFLIELVYSWPGMASYGVNAIMSNDFNSIVGVTMVIGVAFVVSNLVVDVLQGTIDPRVRLQIEGDS